MSLVIRPAEPRDEAAVYALWTDRDSVFWMGRETRVGSREQFHTFYQQAIVNPLWALLVAEKDGEVIGYQAQEVRVLAFGRSMTIRADQRGLGVGQLLLTKMEATLRAKGVPAMSAYIHPSNTPSLSLFRRAGFQMIDAERWPNVAKALAPAAPVAAPKGADRD